VFEIGVLGAEIACPTAEKTFSELCSRGSFLLIFGPVLVCSYKEVSALSFSSPNLLTFFVFNYTVIKFIISIKPLRGFILILD
jgi:hypothetical protein